MSYSLSNPQHLAACLTHYRKAAERKQEILARFPWCKNILHYGVFFQPQSQPKQLTMRTGSVCYQEMQLSEAEWLEHEAAELGERFAKGRDSIRCIVLTAMQKPGLPTVGLERGGGMIQLAWVGEREAVKIETKVRIHLLDFPKEAPYQARAILAHQAALSALVN